MSWAIAICPNCRNRYLNWPEGRDQIINIFRPPVSCGYLRVKFVRFPPDKLVPPRTRVAIGIKRCASPIPSIRLSLVHSDALVRSVDLRAKFTKMALDYTVGFRCEPLQIGIGT